MLIESTFLILASARENASASRNVTANSELVHPIKLTGIDPQILNDLARRMPGVTWLVETDLVKQHKLATMTTRHPPVPRATDRIVIAAELEALGQPLDEPVVYHPEHAAQLLQIPQGAPITPVVLANLVNYASWRLSNTQATLQTVALLTQQDRHPHPQAEAIAEKLLERDLYQRVVLVSLSAANSVLRVW